MIKLSDNLFSSDIKQVPIRNGYGEGLLILGKENPDVVVLCCDLTESTRSLDFAKAYPDRFVEVEGQKYDVLNEQEIWKRGELCSPPWVTYLTAKELQRLHDDGDNIIMSGSPRTVYEAEREMPLLANLYGKENIKIVLIEISAEVTVFRNTHRKICELMRHSILFNDETKILTICPLDGSVLMNRKDLDDPETIKTRLVQYKERTLPLFDYFQDNNFNIHKISGEGSVAEVHGKILKLIE